MLQNFLKDFLKIHQTFFFKLTKNFQKIKPNFSKTFFLETFEELQNFAKFSENFGEFVENFGEFSENFGDFCAIFSYIFFQNVMIHYPWPSPAQFIP